MKIIRIVALERDGASGDDVPNSKIIFLLGVDSEFKIITKYQWFGYIEWVESRVKNEMPFVLRNGGIIHWNDGKNYGTNISQKRIAINQYFEVNHRNSYRANWLYRIVTISEAANDEFKQMAIS